MVKPTQKIVAGVAAFAALAFGGSALAQAAGTTTVAPKATAAQTAPAESTSGPDTDKVQSGDQNTPDTATASSSQAAKEAPGTETADGSGAANEAPGTEKADGSGNEAAGSEVAGNDGPGGHADEPGNPNANTQFQGQQ